MSIGGWRRSGMGKRVMIDSNTWISALIFQGNEKVLIDLLISKDFIIHTCRTVRQEVARILIRKFPVTQSGLESFESFLNSNTIEVPEIEKVEPFNDDDLRIMDAAIRSGCDYFVTGDKRILEWGSFGSLQIVKTAEMLKMVE
jgi:putative PIN family toxin of toxin-antitoxin system